MTHAEMLDEIMDAPASMFLVKELTFVTQVQIELLDTGKLILNDNASDWLEKIYAKLRG